MTAHVVAEAWEAFGRGKKEVRSPALLAAVVTVQTHYRMTFQDAGVTLLLMAAKTISSTLRDSN